MTLPLYRKMINLVTSVRDISDSLPSLSGGVSGTVVENEPDLAVFLLKLKALEQFLQERATLILDDKISPLDILKSQQAPGDRK